MRRILSLAAILVSAALAAIAAGGVASAAASEFCAINSGSPCGSPYSLSTPLEMEQTSSQANFNPTPPTTGVSASCSHSKADLEYVSSGVLLKAKVISFTFSSCTGCPSVTASGLPWEVLAEARGSGNGNGTFDIAGSIELTFSCGEAKIKCVYHQEEIESKFGGGAPAATELSSTLLLLSGGSNCAKTLDWSPTAYKFSSPSPLYLR